MRLPLLLLFLGTQSPVLYSLPALRICGATELRTSRTVHRAVAVSAWFYHEALAPCRALPKGTQAHGHVPGQVRKQEVLRGAQEVVGPKGPKKSTSNSLGDSAGLP